MAAGSLSTCCAAEFVGTFFLVLVTGCSVVCGFWAAAGPASVACALAALTFALGEVSGGHLNPAVSLAACVSGRLPPVEAGAYVVCQAAGAVLGAGTYGALYSRSFVLGPVGHHDEHAAGLLELLYTFMLCLVFLNCDAQRQKGAQFTGAAAGLVLVASGVSATAVSGGCLNPAAALAIDLAGKRLGFGASLGYVAHELLGAAAAGALVRILRPPAEPGRPPERGGALAAVAAEFVGTFLLAFTATLGALFGAPGEVWATAAALGALSLALADVSGAHFNPAVSLAVAACENVQRLGDKEGAARDRLARAGAAAAAQLAAAGLAAAGAALLRECAFVPGSARARRAADAPAMEGGAEALAALQVPQVNYFTNLAIVDCLTEGCPVEELIELEGRLSADEAAIHEHLRELRDVQERAHSPDVAEALAWFGTVAKNSQQLRDQFKTIKDAQAEHVKAIKDSEYSKEFAASLVVQSDEAPGDYLNEGTIAIWRMLSRSGKQDKQRPVAA
mmetsp:Transcript_112054/g.304167  ORF Transcript_112054/g.304167 Transcript_112054/m.304167 type:complete len:506 (+) Transcript_112054:120-1637(+)